MFCYNFENSFNDSKDFNPFNFCSEQNYNFFLDFKEESFFNNIINDNYYPMINEDLFINNIRNDNFDFVINKEKDFKNESDIENYLNNKNEDRISTEKTNNFNFAENHIIKINEKNNTKKEESFKMTSIGNKITKFTTKQKEKKDLIFGIEKIKNNKKVLGRKRKKDNNIENNKAKHNKYSIDNITRKINNKLFDSILNILNLSLNEERENEIFIKIEQKTIININVNYIKNLLKTKLKYIFSKNISKKYINYGLDHNKNLINKIYSENVYKKTISILEKTLFESLEHFRGSNYYPELAGLEKYYENLIKSFRINGETEKYINDFQKIAKTFEVIYNNKKARKRERNTL